MADYQKLAPKRYPRSLGRDEDAETRFWKKQFKNQVVIKEFAPITSVQFSPVAPFDFAVTSSARVMIYASKTNAIKRTFSRFPAPAQGIDFRQDGKLLSVGDESGQVQIFDVNSRTILRQFREHKSAVRATRFLCDNTHVVTGSDDKSVRVYDIPSSTVAHCWEDAHDDYVRSLCASKSNPNLFVSASYDHVVKLWDLRSKSAVVSLKHDLPVEAALLFPGDTMVVSAAGNQLHIWDLLGSSQGRLLHTAVNHQKTITSLCMDGYASRIFTGALDQQVKVFDVRDYHVAHSIKYSAPILSMAVSPDDSHLIVGMANGLLSIREKEVETKGEVQEGLKLNPYLLVKPSLKPMTQHELEQALPGNALAFFRRGTHKIADKDDFVVQKAKRKPKLQQFERLLRQFKYGAALDSALAEHLPATTVTALLEDLVIRGDGLRIALSGRDDARLEPILNFILRYIIDPNYIDLLSHCLNVVLDIYENIIHMSPRVSELINKILRKTCDEMNFQNDLQKMTGVLDMYLNFSSSRTAVQTVPSQ